MPSESFPSHSIVRLSLEIFPLMGSPLSSEADRHCTAELPTIKCCLKKTFSLSVFLL